MAKKSSASIIVDENDICSSNIRVTTKAYPLTREDFKEISETKSNYRDLIIGFISISIGYLVKVIAIWIYNAVSTSSTNFCPSDLVKIHYIEYISIAIPLVPAIIIYIIFKYRKKLDTQSAKYRIQQYFEKNKK